MNLIWMRTSKNMTIGMDVCFKDGFIYTVGMDSSGETDDMFVTKWDTFGSVVWDTKTCLPKNMVR